MRTKNYLKSILIDRYGDFNPEFESELENISSELDNTEHTDISKLDELSTRINDLLMNS